MTGPDPGEGRGPIPKNSGPSTQVVEAQTAAGSCRDVSCPQAQGPTSRPLGCHAGASGFHCRVPSLDSRETHGGWNSISGEWGPGGAGGAGGAGVMTVTSRSFRPSQCSSCRESYWPLLTLLILAGLARSRSPRLGLLEGEVEEGEAEESRDGTT